MEVKAVTQETVSPLLTKNKSGQIEEKIELHLESSQVSSEIEDYPGLKLSCATKPDKKDEEKTGKASEKKQSKTKKERKSLISKDSVSSLAKMLEKHREIKEGSQIPKTEAISPETAVSTPATLPTDRQVFHTKKSDFTDITTPKTSNPQVTIQKSEQVTHPEETVSGELPTDDAVDKDRFDKYLEHSNTLDRFLAQRKISLDSLSYEERARAVLIIEKRASGELTQEEFKDERLYLETEKAKNDTQRIVTPDKDTLNEEEKEQLEEVYTIIGAISTSVTLATAAGLSSEEEKEEFLSDYASEDMLEDQAEITEAVAEVLPDTLDENSVKDILEATTLVSEYQIEEKKELLTNELSHLSDEQKAQIIEHLNTQMEGIRIQNEIITINYIKESQNRTAEKVKTDIKQENKKADNSKAEQHSEEDNKALLEKKYKHKMNLLQTANELIKKFENDLNNLSNKASPQERKKLLSKVEHAKLFKSKLENNVQKLSFEMRITNSNIDNFFTERLLALGNISTQCISNFGLAYNPFAS